MLINDYLKLLYFLDLESRGELMPIRSLYLNEVREGLSYKIFQSSMHVARLDYMKELSNIHVLGTKINVFQVYGSRALMEILRSLGISFHDITFHIMEGYESIGDATVSIDKLISNTLLVLEDMEQWTNEVPSLEIKRGIQFHQPSVVNSLYSLRKQLKELIRSLEDLKGHDCQNISLQSSNRVKNQDVFHFLKLT